MLRKTIWSTWDFAISIKASIFLLKSFWETLDFHVVGLYQLSFAHIANTIRELEELHLIASSFSNLVIKSCVVLPDMLRLYTECSHHSCHQDIYTAFNLSDRHHHWSSKAHHAILAPKINILIATCKKKIKDPISCLAYNLPRFHDANIHPVYTGECNRLWMTCCLYLLQFPISFFLTPNS